MVGAPADPSALPASGSGHRVRVRCLPPETFGPLSTDHTRGEHQREEVQDPLALPHIAIELSVDTSWGRSQLHAVGTAVMNLTQ